jgi:hypothetical protein
MAETIQTDIDLETELGDLGVWHTPIVVTPDDRIRAARALPVDKAVGHIYLTDHTEDQFPPLDPQLSAFDWPSVASTIWNKTIQLAHFVPRDEDIDLTTFAAFRTKFATCPFWNGEFFITSSSFTLNQRRYLPAVNALIGLISDILGGGGDQRTRLISNIKSIAQMISTTGQANEKKSVFTNGTINSYRGGLNQWFCYVSMEMTRSESKYHVKLNQQYKISMGRGKLDFSFCNRHADSILRYDGKLIPDWEEDGGANHFPPNEGPGWEDI